MGSSFYFAIATAFSLDEDNQNRNPGRRASVGMPGVVSGEPLGEPRENQNASVFSEIEIACVLLGILVDERGFEPPASSLRTRKNLR
jgi:hypothetical protein